MADQETLATCYGGGALWGIGWELGVARALEDAGEPLASAPAIGCSAGAWAAAAVALGIAAVDIESVPLVVPDLYPGALVRHARTIFGYGDAPTVRTVVAVDGDATPQALPAQGHPVADLVAASSALPGVFAPVRFDGMTLVDGMCCGSTTYADMAADADRLVVMAPFAHPGLLGGRGVLDRLDVELDRWRARNAGSRVVVFAPDDEVVALVGRGAPSSMFRIELAVEAEAHGRRQAEQWLLSGILAA